MIIMGLIILASTLGMLPKAFWNLWPLLLIVVGLGGLLISDKEAWDGASRKTASKKRKSSKKKR